MIQQSKIKTNYSPSVELYLVVGGRIWPLARIGPDHITPRDGGIELDCCQGEIVMRVDGEERRWNVVLKNGAVPFEPSIPIANAN